MDGFTRYPITNWASHRMFRRLINLNAERCMLPQAPKHPVALYLHIPFCESLCTYCSFHRQLMDEPLARRYFKALRDQIRSVADAGWQISEVYVGGGTPTVLIDELIETLALTRELFGERPLSVETNPNHLKPDIIEPLSAIGVTRLSVGIQSFDDTLLQRMNRRACYGDSAAIAQRLAWVNTRFPTVNADLIFNLPGQSERSLRRDIKMVKSLNIRQVSWYPLMPNHSVQGLLEASLGRWQRKTEWRGFQLIQRELGQRYRPVSAWCYNLGQQAQSDEYFVNNTDYLGLGSGSFSFVGRTLYGSSFDTSGYIEQMNRGDRAMAGYQEFSDAAWLQYQLMMRLFSLDMSEPKGMPTWQKALWRSELQALKAMRAVRSSSGRLEVTQRGQYLALVLMREFFVAVNRLREQLTEKVA